MKQHTRHFSAALFFAAALLISLFSLMGAPRLRHAVRAETTGQSNTPPVAVFTIDPPQGVAGTRFFFDPINSHDNEDSIAYLQTRFDFDGDGVWDTIWNNPTNPAEYHTYSISGTYPVKLEVKDTGDLTATQVLTLSVSDPGTNTAPTAHCAVTPTSGLTNTVFTFDASGSSDAEDPTSALKVKWDQWGTFDFRGQTWQPATQPVTFTYNTNGLHDVDLIVMDSGYLMDDTSCQVEVVPPGGNTAPTASFTITPTTGTITTTFTMDVRGSTDVEDPLNRLSVRFDWTDDGVYDTGWLNASQLWTTIFNTVWGQITVRAQVKDSGGLTGEATQTIHVIAPYYEYLPMVLRSR